MAKKAVGAQTAKCLVLSVQLGIYRKCMLVLRKLVKQKLILFRLVGCISSLEEIPISQYPGT